MKDERERKDERVERVIEKGCNTIAIIVRDERERRDKKVERDQRVEKGHNAIVVVMRNEREEK